MRTSTPWAYRPTRSLLVALPLLVLMLLIPSHAFACGGTSAEKIYCLAPPEIESGESIKPATQTAHDHAKPTTHHATSPATEGPAETTTETETERQSGRGHESHVVPSAKGGNRPGGGKPGNHAGSKRPGTAHQGATETTAPKSSAKPTAKGIQASATTGGSSPVLPILIAIVVLATISIGIVVYRERKGGDGRAGYTGARG